MWFWILLTWFVGFSVALRIFGVSAVREAQENIVACFERRRNELIENRWSYTDVQSIDWVNRRNHCTHTHAPAYGLVGLASVLWFLVLPVWLWWKTIFPRPLPKVPALVEHEAEQAFQASVRNSAALVKQTEDELRDLCKGPTESQDVAAITAKVQDFKLSLATYEQASEALLARRLEKLGVQR